MTHCLDFIYIAISINQDIPYGYLVIREEGQSDKKKWSKEVTQKLRKGEKSCLNDTLS